MSAGAAIAAVVVVTVLALVLVRTRARLRRAEARLTALEARVVDDVVPALHEVRDDANAATATARRAAAVAGADDPPPRLAFESVSGPVVRTLAVSAGAGRTLARLVRPRARRVHVDAAIEAGRRETRRREAALRAVFAEPKAARATKSGRA